MIQYLILYIKYVCIALDQLINTVFNGYPDETLSSRLYRTEQEGFLIGGIFRPIVDALLFMDKNHCKSSYESEMMRKQFPLEMR
jgi:hypothetical protein